MSPAPFPVMRYQSKEREGSFSSGGNQMIHSLVLFCPPLFGCQSVTLENVVTRKEFEDLSGVLEKLGAVKIAEAHDPGKSHYFYRVEKRPIALLLEEQKFIKMIAPRPLIEYA